jgi:23S rRNA U2552 (ribose-2'-O)-methylase RlmE/FtsJ
MTIEYPVPKAGPKFVEDLRRKASEGNMPEGLEIMTTDDPRSVIIVDPAMNTEGVLTAHHNSVTLIYNAPPVSEAINRYVAKESDK